MADGRGAGALSPRVVLGVFAALLVLVLLASPASDERAGDPRLTSRSASPNGARGLAETLGRLGWRVTRRARGYVPPLGAPPEPRVVHAVLAPPTPLRASEVHALLDAVRRGAALLAVVTRGSSLADSLGYVPSRGGARLVAPAADTAGCPPARFREGALRWPSGEVQTLWLASADNPGVGDRPVPRQPDATDFLEARPESSGDAGDALLFPATRGFTLGRGRVVVVADPDLLRNDVLRVCRWGAGLAAVRMSEWLAGAPGAGRHVVFDEFHQGPESDASPARAVRDALVATGGGRLVLQLAAAALVLLAAVGARALPPEPRPRVARRSPLEHVDALALAYAEIGASRLVARRLARGLRRRHGRLARHPGDQSGDAAFLSAVATRRPGVAAHVARLVTAGERGHVAPSASAAAAAAIDDALTPRSRTPRPT